jgi:hypothetical protein
MKNDKQVGTLALVVALVLLCGACNNSGASSSSGAGNSGSGLVQL